MKTDKEFKCVDFKHQAQMGIYKEIKNLTPDEEIKYFHRKIETSAFGKLWEKLHGAPITAGGHGKG
jgi:hypothetical protein